VTSLPADHCSEETKFLGRWEGSTTTVDHKEVGFWSLRKCIHVFLNLGFPVLDSLVNTLRASLDLLHVPGGSSSRGMSLLFGSCLVSYLRGSYLKFEPWSHLSSLWFQEASAPLGTCLAATSNWIRTASFHIFSSSLLFLSLDAMRTDLLTASLDEPSAHRFHSVSSVRIWGNADSYVTVATFHCL
jgi:hypothetical protein